VPDTTLCVSQQWLIDVTYPRSIYRWQDGSTMPQYKVTSEGLYSVDVTNTCGTTTGTSIVKYDNCDCNFYVPNAFTPNNDGNNDVFKPRYICLFSSYTLKIFNRWGQLVFASANPDNGWDGRLNGQAQPTGSYIWVMLYKDSLKGKMIEQKGIVELIR
jgi:gliding motility-associated-like protein